MIDIYKKRRVLVCLLNTALIFVFAVSVRAANNESVRIHSNHSGSFESGTVKFYSNRSFVNNLPDYKSPGKAFFLSFLLPGAGEFYAGSKKNAAVFFASEVLLWGGFAACRTLSKWKTEDGIALARGHAGIDMAGRDHNYYVAVENYMSIRAYNEAKLLQRDLAAMYPEDEYHSWEWDSDDSRRQFESLRVQSDSWENRSVLIIGAVLLNHIVSGIDAARLARKHNRGLEQPMHVHVTALREGGAMLTFRKLF